MTATPFLLFRRRPVPGPYWYRSMGPVWWPALSAAVRAHLSIEHEMGGRVAAALASYRPIRSNSLLSERP